MKVEQQKHGYSGGHKLLSSSVKLDRRDQEVVDRLSDISGAPGADESFPSYLTAYPLPSEQYYVLARTWYDSTAPRAGCVVTHSLLVPTEAWATAENLLIFAELHERFSVTNAVASSPLEAADHSPLPYPPATGSGFGDVCEAIFFEERQPILWMTHADEWTGLRLLQALWPALRRRFSIQTYALKPRSGPSGAFDLMIAPRWARSRFSGWTGRRVEGDSQRRTPWTDDVVQSIFFSGFPSLQKLDPLGLVRESAGDANTLRLSLLWDQLAKDVEAPRSKLAMLDVLEALPASEERRTQLSDAVISSALSDVENGRAEARYLALLLGKIRPERLPDFRQQLERAVYSELLREPASLPEFRPAAAGSLFADLLTSAVARVSLTLDDAAVRRLLSVLTDRELVDVIADNPSVLVRLVGSEGADKSLLKKATRSIRNLSPAAIEVVWSDLIGLVRTTEHAQFLAALLKDTNQQQLAQATRVLVQSEATKFEPLVDELVKAWSRSPEGLIGLRSVLCSSVPEPTLALIERTFGRDDDLLWFLECSASDALRNEVVSSLLRSSRSSKLLRPVLERPEYLRQLISLSDANDDFELLLNAIGAQPAIPDEAFSVLSEALTSVRPAERFALLTALVNWALALPIDSRRLKRTLGLPDAALMLTKYPRLIPSFFPDAASTEDISKLLEAIGSAPQPVRQLFAEHIPGIVRRLTLRRTELSHRAYVTWADLLRTRQDKHSARAAWTSLDYVLDKEYRAAFPVFLEALPLAFGRIQQELSNKRVAPFISQAARYAIRTQTPAAASIRAMLETGEPDEFVRALLNHSGGKAFIRRAIDELKGGDERDRMIASALARLDLEDRLLWWPW